MGGDGIHIRLRPPSAAGTTAAGTTAGTTIVAATLQTTTAVQTTTGSSGTTTTRTVAQYGQCGEIGYNGNTGASKPLFFWILNVS